MTSPYKRPFRFGVTSRGATSAHAWADLARKVEALGYDTLFAPDHFRDQLAPLPALVAAAQATRSLRVGTLVLANDFRHPAVMAKEAATVDILSDGRLELGIGAGWAGDEYAQAGIPFDPAPTRVQRLFESVRVVKDLLEGAAVEHHGVHYVLEALEGRPLPVQRPRPPLLIGGGGRRILEFAACEADIVGVNIDLRSGQSMNPRAQQFGAGSALTGTAEAVDERIAWIKQSAGSRFDRLELNVRVFVTELTDDRRGVADTHARTFGLDVDELLGAPHVLIGNTDQLVEDLLERRERFGLTYYVVPDDVCDRFAPVVDRLAVR